MKEENEEKNYALILTKSRKLKVKILLFAFYAVVSFFSLPFIARAGFFSFDYASNSVDAGNNIITLIARSFSGADVGEKIITIARATYNFTALLRQDLNNQGAYVKTYAGKINDALPKGKDIFQNVSVLLSAPSILTSTLHTNIESQGFLLAERITDITRATFSFTYSLKSRIDTQGNTLAQMASAPSFALSYFAEPFNVWENAGKEREKIIAIAREPYILSSSIKDTLDNVSDKIVSIAQAPREIMYDARNQFASFASIGSVRDYLSSWWNYFFGQKNIARVPSPSQAIPKKTPPFSARKSESPQSVKQVAQKEEKGINQNIIPSRYSSRPQTGEKKSVQNQPTIIREITREVVIQNNQPQPNDTNWITQKFTDVKDELNGNIRKAINTLLGFNDGGGKGTGGNIGLIQTPDRADHFTVQKTLTANDTSLFKGAVTTNGNVTIGGNLTLSGSQSSSNIQSITASSTSPILSLTQQGSGDALRVTGSNASKYFQMWHDGTDMRIQTNAGSGSNIYIHPDGGTVYLNTDLVVNGGNAQVKATGRANFAYDPADTATPSLWLSSSSAYTDAKTYFVINPASSVSFDRFLHFKKGSSDISIMDSSGNFTLAGKLDIQANATSTFAGPINIGSGNIILGSNGNLSIAGNLSVAGSQTFTGGATFTTITATTSLTTPLVIGGTGTTSALALRSTSGAGTTGADIIFQTGNNGATEAMRILNNGNVGIGTTGPTALLHVTASSTTQTVLVNQTGTGTVADFQTNGTSRLYINSSGNVGIGQTTPTAVLHLKAGTATANTAPLKFTSGTNLTTAEAGAMEYDGTSLLFSPSTTRLRAVLTDNSIPSNGMLAIGNGTNYTNATLTGTTDQITVTNGAGTITLSIPQSINTTSAPQFARLGLGTAADGTNILTATSASTADLSKTLNITHTGAITGTGYAGYFSKTGASTTNVGGYFSATGATNNYGLIVENGNVGIGDTTPSYLLTVGSGDLFGVNSSGYALLPNGSSTTPSLAFTGDTDTGIFSGGANVLGLATAGLERMRVDASGNVGIGTTGPTANLDIYGGSGNGRMLFSVTLANPTLSLYGDATNGYYPGIDFCQLANCTTQGGTIQGYDGLLLGPRGVGYVRIRNESGLTNTIKDMLSIEHNTSGTPANNLGVGILFRLESSTTMDRDLARIASYWTDVTDVTRTSNLGFSTILNGTITQQMTIQGNGNVGIGTTGPTALLHVTASSTNTLLVNNTNNSNPGGALADFQNAGTSRLYVANNGNVGIGQTTPTAVLHLKAGTATASTAPLKFTSGTNLTTAEAGAMEYDGTSLLFSPSTTRLRAVLTDNSIPSNGMLAIGNGTNYTNATLTGTTDQITVTNGAGSITLSTPQSINTTSAPQFARLGLGTAADGTNILTATSASTVDLSKTLNITHSGAITGTGYAGYFSKTGVSTTNVGLYATASGATNNYAAIFEAGNVGIGDTTPSYLLTVGSGDLFGVNSSGFALLPYGTSTTPSLAFTGDTDTGLFGKGSDILAFGTGGAERMRIDASGNVGIGTISPSVSLSVAGQCVTGDTRLRRRRRRKGKNGKWIEELDEVMIKDIQQGDEIQSLDEKTGKLVWSKVKALMDMGVKPIYTVTTATGNTIRTTGEHPYLVLDSQKVLNHKLKAGIFIDDSNMYHAFKKYGWRVDFKKLNVFLSSVFDIKFINYHLAMPRQTDKSYSGALDYIRTLPKEMELKTKPLKYIYDNERKQLITKGDVDLDIGMDVVSHLEELDIFIIASGDSDYLALADFLYKQGKQVLFVGYKENMAWELRLQRHLLLNKVKDFIVLGGNKKTTPEKAGAALLSQIYQNKKIVSSPKIWKKVAYLKEGNMIAIRKENGKVVWDRIAKIEKTKPEQVYDIEVEGTHNFIGNDIIAHNTYINSTANTANIKGLEIDQSGAVTGTGYGLHVEKTGASTTNVAGYFSATGATNNYGLIVENGNVGIGTAGPGTKLSIASGNSTFEIPLHIINTNTTSGARTAAFEVLTGYPRSGATLRGSIELEGTAASAQSDMVFYLGSGTGNNERVRIQSNGNVGIGTTGPTALLHVTASSTNTLLVNNTNNSNPGGALADFQNAGTSRLYIANNGNVGIGTTLPSVALNIVGQCVTGDTKLRRKRKRSRKNDKGELVEEEYFEDVRIDEIKAGDEILTLDENTGRLAVSKVKALMDMGVKPIYTVTTATGKTIRTTGNHPYLRAPENISVKTAVFIDGANFENSVTQIKGWADYKEMKAVFPNSPLFFYQVDFGDKKQGGFFARLKNIGFSLITKSIKVIKQRNIGDKRKGNFDVEIAVDSIDIKNNYDAAVLFSGDSDFEYLVKYLQKQNKKVMVVSPWRRTARELRLAADVYMNLKQMPFIKDKSNEKRPRRADHDSILHGAISIIEQVMSYVKGGEWTKVSELREGQMIATAGDNGKPIYERIAKIEKTKPEQVYDIEVEGTHNFVGNDIVAHNTYIQSSAATANIKGLEIDQSGAVSGTGYGLHVEKTGASTTNVGLYATASGATNNYAAIFEGGNVGIGTTGPGAALEVVGDIFLQDSTPIFKLGISSDNFAPKLFGYQAAFATDNFGISMNDNGASSPSKITSGYSASRVRFYTTNVNSATINFETMAHGASSYGTRMAITSDGNVGIGDTSPASLFTVGSGDLFQVNSSGFALLPYGTSTTPSLAFTGDTDTGLFGKGSDILAFGTGGAERMRIDASGNIGIGTTGPGSKLQIIHPNAQSQSKVLSFRDATFPTYGWDFDIDSATTGNLFLNSYVSGVEATRITFERATGNVGIGTTTPTALLHVTASSTNTLLVNNTNNSNPGGALADFQNAGTSRLYVANNGNVGIGTTSPETKLVVANSSGHAIITADAEANSAAWTYYQLAGTLKAAVGYNTTYFSLYESGAHRLVIKDGNVGIGTTDPVGYTLHIKNATPTIRLSSAAETNGLFQELYFGTPTYNRSKIKSTNVGTTGGGDLSLWTSPDGGSALERVTILSGGNVGIGTTSPGSILALGGTAARIFGMDRNTTAATAGQGFTISSGGAIAGTADLAGGDLSIKSGISTGTGTSALHFFTATAGVTGTADNAPTEKMTILGSGNVGIGTTGPTALLHVTASSTNTLLVNNTNNSNPGGALADFQNAGTSRLYVANNGNVGIGTTGPSSKLAVVGDIRLPGNGNSLYLGDQSVNGAPSVNFVGSNSAINWQIRQNNVASGDLTFTPSTAGGGATFTTPVMSLYNGNVGIGTTGPGKNLEVKHSSNQQLIRLTRDTQSFDIGVDSGGALYGFGVWDSAGNPLFTVDSNAGAAIGNVYALSNPPADGLIVEGNVGIGTTGPTALLHVTASSTNTLLVNNTNNSNPGGALADFQNAGTSRLYVANNGNVGIGTTGPTRLLTVHAAGEADIALTTAASDAAARNWLLGTNVSAYGDFQIKQSTTKGGDTYAAKFTIDTNGNVGIGTTGPDSKLHVYGTTGGSDQNLLQLEDGTGGSNKWNFLLWETQDDGTLMRNVARIGARHVSGVNDGTRGGELKFQTMDSSAVLQDRVTIDRSGNVGIGTTGPGNKLDVNGGIRVATLAAAAATTVCRDSNNDLSTCSSSRAFKDNIMYLSDAQAQDILNQITNTPLASFTFKTDHPLDTRFGIIAEEAPLALRYIDEHQNPNIDFYSAQLGYTWGGIKALAKNLSLLENGTIRIGNSTSTAQTIINPGDFVIGYVDGANSTSTSSTFTGHWVTLSSIKDTITGWVVDAFKALGLAIENGITRLQALTVGSSSKPQGITIYDEDTGAPYCIKMKTGQMVSVAGECGTAQATPALQPILEPIVQQVDMGNATSTTAN